MTTVPKTIDLDAIRQRLADADHPARLTPTKYRTSDLTWVCRLSWPDNPEAEIAEVYDFGHIGLMANAAADLTDLLAEVDRLRKGIEKLVESVQFYCQADEEFCGNLDHDLRDLLDGPR